jgi:hypothetical protein
MPFPNVPVASTVLDSILFRDSFGTPSMRAIFSDHALIERYVEVEVALARAEARCGVIPANAAEEIATKSNAAAFDFDLLRRETENVGYPILPVVHQMAKQCGEAGRYVHWGATTQDIMDTAVVLQIRAALDLVAADLKEMRRILGDLAKRYRDTPMAGRTHLQQALPITFGYKAAIWRAMFDRHAERQQLLPPECWSSSSPGRRHAGFSGRSRPRRASSARDELVLRSRRRGTSHAMKASPVGTCSASSPARSASCLRRDVLMQNGSAEHSRSSPGAAPRHDAASVHLVRAHARGRQTVRQHTRPHARRHGAGLRAGDRTLARGWILAGSFVLTAGATPSGEVHAGRAHCRRSACCLDLTSIVASGDDESPYPGGRRMLAAS